MRWFTNVNMCIWRNVCLSPVRLANLLLRVCRSCRGYCPVQRHCHRRCGGRRCCCCCDGLLQDLSHCRLVMVMIPKSVPEIPPLSPVVMSWFYDIPGFYDMPWFYDMPNLANLVGE